MTENEAIERIKYRIHTAEHVVGKNEMEDLKMATKALEEVQQYRELCTMRMCQDAVNAQYHPRKVSEKCREDELNIYDTHCGYCPVCHEYVIFDFNEEYCGNCGQKLDWSDENV